MSAVTQVTGIVTVSAGGATDVQPAAGESWVVTSLQGTADISVKLLEGALVTNALFTLPVSDKRIYINNSCYVRLTNGSASDVDVYYSGYKLPAGMTVTSTVQSVAASSNYDLQPAAGSVRLIGGVFGSSDTCLRLVKAGVTAGILRADLPLGSLDDCRVLCDNTVYGRISNTYGGGARTFAVSAVDIAGGMTVGSNCYEIANTATQNVQPAAGEVWVVYEWGWSDDEATLTTALYDGTDTVAITNTDEGVIRGVRDLALTIDNTRYLQFTNNSGSTRYLCVSAVKLP